MNKQKHISIRIDEEVLNAAGQLKIVVRAGAGYDNVSLEAASSINVFANLRRSRAKSNWNARTLDFSPQSATIMRLGEYDLRRRKNNGRNGFSDWAHSSAQ